MPKKINQPAAQKAKEATQPIAPVPIAPKIESTPLKYGKNTEGNPVVAVNYYSSEDANKANDAYNERLKEIMGVKDTELANSILYRAARGLEVAHPDQKENIVLQTLNNLKPKDVIESRLIVQETVLHSELMKVLYFLSNSENAWEAEVRLNMITKLVRLHNETVETLSKYRRGGTQTVNVQHAVVDNRAVVNNYGVGGGVNENRGDKPCIENAELKREPMAIDHVKCPQWPMGVVGSMAESVPALKPKQAEES